MWFVSRVASRHGVSLLSSSSRTCWRGETETLSFWFDERLCDVSWRKGVGEVRKEKVEVCWRRVDLRIGWEFWSLWRDVWRQ